MSALTLALAESRYRVSGLSPDQHGNLHEKFQALLCADDGTADVTVDIHLDPNPGAFMSAPVGPVEYPLALTHQERHIDAAGIGFRARIEREPLGAQLHTCLEDDWFVGAFENVFRILASYRIFADGGLVLHSAGLVDAGRGFVFCGRSGAGKTTLCRLAQELEITVLSDELNAIVPMGGALGVAAMPFAGDFGGEVTAHPPYPLRGLLGLRHEALPRVTECSKAEAVSRIVASCPYVNTDPALGESLDARAVALVSRLEFRVLGFAKSPTFWSVVDHEYGPEPIALSS